MAKKISKNARTNRGTETHKKMTKVITAVKTKKGSWGFKEKFIPKEEADEMMKGNEE